VIRCVDFHLIQFHSDWAERIDVQFVCLKTHGSKLYSLCATDYLRYDLLRYLIEPFLLVWFCQKRFKKNSVPP
jgi:hypothetical protein